MKERCSDLLQKKFRDAKIDQCVTGLSSYRTKHGFYNFSTFTVESLILDPCPSIA